MTTIEFHYENIHKLNTKEDSTYFHKFLGTICLCNFIYRFGLYFRYGNMYLDKKFDLFLIGLHGLLSISSLIFHIPFIRNPSKPMIYPEFRLHSIIFALRSVIVCYQYYYHLHYMYPIITCYFTMISADLITRQFNIEGKNGKTMRNMPFDNLLIPLDVQKEITKMQSIMQIGATTYMLGDIQTAFSPLLAIQLAAFLMTLVRKSIISTTTWHAIYSLTLWINIILYLSQPFGYIFIHQVMMNNYVYIFFPKKINKYIAWTINFGIFILYKELEIENKINDSLLNYIEIMPFMKIFIIVSFFCYFNKFKILFIK